MHAHTPTYMLGAQVTQPILEGLNLDLTAERVKALVGPSGSGKSTVLRLLLRFYSATSGSITIGGTPIDELPNGWLRAHVCVVEQEPTLVEIGRG